MTVDQAQQETVTDPQAMRAAAADLHAVAKAQQRQAYEIRRQAEQLEHEAGLWQVADAAEDEFVTVRERTPTLAAAVDATVKAGRRADDKAREAAEYLAEVTQAEQRAQNRNAAPETLGEAAVRVHSARGTLERKESALQAARLERGRAEQALAAHRQDEAAAHGAYVQATRRATNPGEAPRRSPLPIGVGRPGDMTGEERDMAALAVLLLSSTGGSTPQLSGAQSHGGQGTTRGDLARQDPRGFRHVRRGRDMVVLPPA